jgi:digeranylgeranylglycerophospholipid reductase
MSASSHDLVIVGAGFAGLACARAAAVLGLRVAVVERKHDPPSLAFLDLTSPGYFFLATDTPALLRWLAQEAEAAGAEILLGTPYRGARRAGGGFELSGTRIHARFLAGADGPLSRVARDFGLGANQSFLAGVEVELDGLRGFREDRLHCFLDSRLAPGYIGWVVPGVGVTQVGIAASPPERARLDPFLDRLKGVFPLNDAQVVGRRAGLIPVNGPVRPVGADGLLLLGDAAGWVSPLTGGGLYNALHFGRLAGHAIAQHLLENGPSPHLELPGMLPRYGTKRLVRLALELAPPNWILDALVTSPPFRALARRIFFHHRGIFSLDAWREPAAAQTSE